VLPDFKFYDRDTKTLGAQVPISSQNRPSNNTYFIGIVGSPQEKLLCYHISNGQYIVVSYNFSSAKLLQEILDFDLYDIEIAEYENSEIKYQNPASLPKMDTTS